MVITFAEAPLWLQKDRLKGVVTAVLLFGVFVHLHTKFMKYDSPICNKNFGWLGNNSHVRHSILILRHNEIFACKISNDLAVIRKLPERCCGTTLSLKISPFAANIIAAGKAVAYFFSAGLYLVIVWKAHGILKPHLHFNVLTIWHRCCLDITRSKSHKDVHTTRLRNQEDRSSHNHPYEPSAVILSFLHTGAIRTNTRCNQKISLCRNFYWQLEMSCVSFYLM